MRNQIKMKGNGTMKKRIYLIRKTVAGDGERLLEVSGKEFYDFVNSAEKEKRYFIRIVDDLSYEGAEIIAQTSPEMYKSWRKEYDAHRYLENLKQEYEEFSLEEDMLQAGDAFTVDADEAMPEEYLLQKEAYRKLKEGLESLEAAERALIDLLYLREPPMTQREAAEHFGISLSALHKRKEKILKKLRCFW